MRGVHWRALLNAEPTGVGTATLCLNRGETAAIADQWVDNARSRRAVNPTPCARPGARIG